MIRSVVVPAHAKINLFLRVLHRRDDGYREIETLFQAVSLADTVTVSTADDGVPVAPDRAVPTTDVGSGPEGGSAAAPLVEVPSTGVRLEVEGPWLGPLDQNLAYRAAVAFLSAYRLDRPVHVRLVKRIPAGSGLGGGSADAAAVLLGLGRLFGVGDPITLHRLASALGSDVPFFLGDSPLALGRGRGERLTAMAPLPEAHLVVALPPIASSTSEAYAALARARGDESPVDDVDEPRVIDLAGLSWKRVMELAENDFEPLIAARHHQVRASLAGLKSCGATAALLSGSGSASFGIFPGRSEAEDAARRLTGSLGWPCLATRTLRTMPPARTVGDGG